MKQFHRQKRKQLNKKTIEQTTFILLTKYNWLYNYPPPTKKEIKNFLKFLQIEKLYNLYAYKIYNITKTINRHFKDFQEITECFR